MDLLEGINALLKLNVVGWQLGLVGNHQDGTSHVTQALRAHTLSSFEPPTCSLRYCCVL